MKRNDRIPIFVVGALFFLCCILAVYNQGRTKETPESPRALFADATPLGGKGLRLMLQNMGYTVKRTDDVLTAMPPDAGVWLLLDPQTQFTPAESTHLMQWVRQGGTFIWAAPRSDDFGLAFGSGANRGYREVLNRDLKIEPTGANPFYDTKGEPLPPTVAMTWSSPGVYRSGVNVASGSGGTFTMKSPHVELSGSPFGAEVAVAYLGKGRIIVTPDALLFTNYGLSKDDNAVFVSNFVRANLEPSAGAVYFDERSHTDNKKEVQPNLLYYLWQPPLRWALLQLLAAGLLVWAFFGRRLGAPVPLPEREPVTRASQYAIAMGALFRKANRPRAAAGIIGEEFRRTLVRRLGMSVTDSDRAIAERAAQVTGLSAPMIDRLLLKSKNPAEDESSALNDAQEMEIVLRRLSS